MTKRPSSKQRRNKINGCAMRDGGYWCRYCGIALTPAEATLDHVMPLAMGGTNDMPNLVIACRPCNEAKGDWLVPVLPVPSDWQAPPAVIDHSRQDDGGVDTKPIRTQRDDGLRVTLGEFWPTEEDKG